MDIDDRARRAADSLERHVTQDLDVDGARVGLDRSRSSNTKVARLATAGFVLALVAGLAVFATNTDRDRGEVRTPEVEMDEPTPSELLEIMPAGPLDGKESWRLPVAASPQSGLVDGQWITIVGRGFFPHDYLGIVHCSAEADTHNAGVAACDLGTDGGFQNVQYAEADANGDVMAQIQVRRFITTPQGGAIDCFEAAERCLIGVGATSDYDRSGGTYINFAEAAPYPEASMALDPDGTDLVPGAPVTVTVSGWIADRPIQYRLCLEPTEHDDIDACFQLAADRADMNGDHSATFALPSGVEVNGEVIDCTSCVIVATGIGVSGATSQDFPEPIPVTFDRSEPETPEPETTEPETTEPETTEPETTEPETAEPEADPVP